MSVFNGGLGRGHKWGGLLCGCGDKGGRWDGGKGMSGSMKVAG